MFHDHFNFFLLFYCLLLYSEPIKQEKLESKQLKILLCLVRVFKYHMHTLLLSSDVVIDITIKQYYYIK